MSQSFFQGAKDVKINGGVQIAAAPGGSVTINQAAQARALDTLSAAAAHTALHDSAARFDAPRCHRNTRTSYLEGLERWILGRGGVYDSKRLIWLTGGAGAGKSAIMQSIVERCVQHAVILGTFFFSRADQSRNCAEVLIPTLAYQLACAFPDTLSVLEPIILRNPLIFKASLRTHTYELLVRPLLHLVETGVIDNASLLRRVFVIDGLDECNDPEKQAHIIHVIATVLCDYDLPICFLIASRPEMAISRAFQREDRLHDTLSSITLDNNVEARSDICQFIKDSFLDILDTHPLRTQIPPNWPGPGSISTLEWKSSGHFIYAATVMKFISSSDEYPVRALQVVEGLVPSRMGNPFAELDALYLHILTSEKYSSQVLAILRYCVLTNLDNTVKAVCFMYPHFSPQDVELLLSHVQALVSLSPNREAELCISLKHASLTDFLRSANRSNKIYMGAGEYRASLLPRFFMLFDNRAWISSRCSPHRNYLVYEVADAIRHSQDISLLQSLISAYPPRHIWNFLRGRGGPGLYFMSSEGTALATISSYLAAIRDSAANNNNALYIHHFKTFFSLLMERLNTSGEVEPHYQVIPALLFSSRPCCLIAVARDLINRFPQRIESVYSHVIGYLHYRDIDMEVKTDLRSYEAIRSLPQAQMSWGAEMANALELVLQHLLGYRWTPEYFAPNPHQRWLNKVKPLKHVSQGSPKLPSAFYLYLRTLPTPRVFDDDAFTATNDAFLNHGFSEGTASKIFERREQCVVFLRTIIHYLHKCDLTSALAWLARKSLPKAALWFPRLMKKARKKMDAYVRRWDDSLDGLLEKTRSLTINEMD